MIRSNPEKRGIVAELIHSGLSSREIDIVFDNAQYGKTKIFISLTRTINIRKSI